MNQLYKKIWGQSNTEHLLQYDLNRGLGLLKFLFFVFVLVFILILFRGYNLGFGSHLLNLIIAFGFSGFSILLLRLGILHQHVSLLFIAFYTLILCLGLYFGGGFTGFPAHSSFLVLVYFLVCLRFRYIIPFTIFTSGLIFVIAWLGTNFESVFALQEQFAAYQKASYGTAILRTFLFIYLCKMIPQLFRLSQRGYKILALAWIAWVISLFALPHWIYALSTLIYPLLLLSTHKLNLIFSGLLMIVLSGIGYCFIVFIDPNWTPLANYGNEFLFQHVLGLAVSILITISLMTLAIFGKFRQI